MKMRQLFVSNSVPRRVVPQDCSRHNDNPSVELKRNTLYKSGFHSATDGYHMHSKALETAGLKNHPENHRNNSCSGQNYSLKV
jgi:hypothetical protein